MDEPATVVVFGPEVASHVFHFAFPCADFGSAVSIYRSMENFFFFFFFAMHVPQTRKRNRLLVTAAISN